VTIIFIRSNIINISIIIIIIIIISSSITIISQLTCALGQQEIPRLKRGYGGMKKHNTESNEFYLILFTHGGTITFIISGLLLFSFYTPSKNSA
jgi:hypothetical protein